MSSVPVAINHSVLQSAGTQVVLLAIAIAMQYQIRMIGSLCMFRYTEMTSSQQAIKFYYMKNFHAGWHLIYTKPRHEKKVHTRLAELNINSLLPTKKTLRTWHDRKKYIDEPLFPSYVFIYLSDAQNYYDGADVEGALYYVKTGKEISRIEDTVINNIIVASCQGDIEVTDSHFNPGQQLVIREGALTGLSCELIQYNNKQKLLVRVNLLKRNILLTLPKEHLLAL